MIVWLLFEFGAKTMYVPFRDRMCASWRNATPYHSSIDHIGIQYRIIYSFITYNFDFINSSFVLSCMYGDAGCSYVVCSLVIRIAFTCVLFFVGRCCCCCCAYVSDMCVFGSQLYANANETHAHIKCCMHTFITQSNRMFFFFVQLLVVCCLLLQAVVTGASFSHHLNEGWVSAMWRGHQCCNVQRKYSGC